MSAKKLHNRFISIYFERCVERELKTFFGSTPFYAALFVDSDWVLRGSAWELLTNSNKQTGRDFMSEMGLVQAAMKEVDKISKSNA